MGENLATCRIEHIFGFVEGAMNGSLVRSIGMMRSKASNALTNLVYNIFYKKKEERSFIAWWFRKKRITLHMDSRFSHCLSVWQSGITHKTSRLECGVHAVPTASVLLGGWVGSRGFLQTKAFTRRLVLAVRNFANSIILLKTGQQ